MGTSSPGGPVNRREFIAGAAGLAAGAIIGRAARAASTMPASAPGGAEKLIGIQVGAVSFVDEGVDQVLDVLQQRAAANAIFLATFTYGRGIGGRQVPGQPLPDHGVQAYDEGQFHGGNYATPHPRFYEKTVLKQT